MGHDEDPNKRVEELTAGDPHLRDGSVRDDGGPAGPPLHDVTPGLDRFERVRAAALRAVMFTRAVSRDVAAVIDKGVSAASQEARAQARSAVAPIQTTAQAIATTPRRGRSDMRAAYVGHRRQAIPHSLARITLGWR